MNMENVYTKRTNICEMKKEKRKKRKKNESHGLHFPIENG